MTTLAYKSGVLACDSRMTAGDVAVGQAVKTIKNGPFLFAGCGAWPLVHRFLEWASRGCVGNIPEMSIGTGEDSAAAGGFIFLPSGVVLVCTHYGISPRKCDYFADGSGRDLALGAMAFGATAEEAIRASIRHDIYSGGDVQVLTHE